MDLTGWKCNIDDWVGQMETDPLSEMEAKGYTGKKNYKTRIHHTT